MSTRNPKALEKASELLEQIEIILRPHDIDIAAGTLSLALAHMSVQRFDMTLKEYLHISEHNFRESVRQSVQLEVITQEEAEAKLTKDSLVEDKSDDHFKEAVKEAVSVGILSEEEAGSLLVKK